VIVIAVIIGLVALTSLVAGKAPVARKVAQKDCFYKSSLHYTANGMGYWYDKKRGGLEVLTGIPYNKLGCKNCHAAGCDRCHKVVEKKKDCVVMKYSTRAAAKQAMCLKCHGRERAMIRINHKNKQEDVHLKQGMSCMGCHSQREMHGDGVEYKSLKQPGAMDTRCEKCHESIKPTESHTVHKKKVDCKACHLRHVVSCTNCHFDTLIKKGKRKAIPVSGWLFLINYRGQVTSGSMQTFVVKGRKTFLMFAPHMSHSVMKKGRSCDQCHGTATMKTAVKGKITLTWLKDKKVQNLKGVIPVVDSVDYKCVYQNFKAGKWHLIKNPAKPVRQYAAFGKPLTRAQLKALAKPQKAPPPKMK
jgi:hypothetical protein